ncbi:hypothetical protein DRQ53_01705 [bacterium]|nr:MAG: hypothetical protein DRQ32_05510 [bacterium]RKZ18002.1 MAG: hypothetical protein DRQ53_01705 [bacterium]
MKICIPSQDDHGLESEIHDHFGSAPWFTIVDTANDEAVAVRNPSCHRSVGACHHVDMLQARKVGVVVSSGMGRKAHDALHQSGISVLAATGRQIGDIVSAVKAGGARPLDLSDACAGGHGYGGGHGHGHGGGHGRGHGHGHGHGYACSHASEQD